MSNTPDVSRAVRAANVPDDLRIMERFDSMWAAINEIGVTATGTRRYSWTEEDQALRRWFIREAEARGMEVYADRNGNLRAWWGHPHDGAIVTGSHLDSVADGGLWDGPLGVVLGFLAVDVLAAQAERGEFRRDKSICVVDYMDEEGTRFGVACLGSKLMTGALDPDTARSLVDKNGVTLAEAMRAAGADPELIGKDPVEIGHTGAHVEVHIEQGKQLADQDAAVGVATSIWPHGRWEFTFEGLADHAGTAKLEGRRDASLPFAHTVLAAREIAQELGARATFGRFSVEPGGPNVVPAKVVALLDARAATDVTLRELVGRIREEASRASARHSVEMSIREISTAPIVEFDEGLRELHGKLAAEAGEIMPEIPTQAGHDSGILAACVPTSMLFVRSPHGISHSPLEDADPADVLAGLRALVRSLAALAGAGE